MPLLPSTVIVWPVLMTVVPMLVPTTAGTPHSRATIALWERIPPTSDTTAPARENSGTHGGRVISTTMISPSSRSSVAWARDRQTRAVPVYAPGDPPTALITLGSV